MTQLAPKVIRISSDLLNAAAPFCQVADKRATEHQIKGTFMKSKKTSFTSIDEYIATFPEVTQKIMKQLRETIKAAAPGVEEAISYNMPTFNLNGKYLVYFAGW